MAKIMRCAPKAGMGAGRHRRFPRPERRGVAPDRPVNYDGYGHSSAARAAGRSRRSNSPQWPAWINRGWPKSRTARPE